WRCPPPRPKECWIRDSTPARRAALEILRAVRAVAPLGAARDDAVTDQAERDRALDLERADPRLHDVLRLGAYQLRCLTRVPRHAAVSTSVELARETAGEGPARFVNYALRKLGTGYRVPGIGSSHPEWLVRRWEARFGSAETQRLLAWNDTKPSLTLQPARWDQATLTERLRDAGIDTTNAPFDAGLRINPVAGTRYPVPRDFPGFTEGGFFVQDPAHALV